LELPPGDTTPGLPIALGGVSVDLEGLVTLYAAIAARGGVPRRRWAAAEPPPAPAPFLSPVAAWYLTRILEEAPPPPNYVSPQHRKQPHPIAFKTGTSYGSRAAWAIGFDRAYTVGVWIGRPDGTFATDRLG